MLETNRVNGASMPLIVADLDGASNATTVSVKKKKKKKVKKQKLVLGDAATDLEKQIKKIEVEEEEQGFTTIGRVDNVEPQ